MEENTNSFTKPFFLYGTNKGIKGKDQIKFSQDNICNKISFIKIYAVKYIWSHSHSHKMKLNILYIIHIQDQKK